MKIKRNGIFVAGAGGGLLNVISNIDGTMFKVHIPEGRHRVSRWYDLVPPDHDLEVGKGLEYFPPRAGVVTTVHPLALNSDANPLFKVTSASRAEREMRVEINEMRALRTSLTKLARQKALDSVVEDERIPDNRQVVEDPETAVKPPLQGVAPANKKAKAAVPEAAAE